MRWCRTSTGSCGAEMSIIDWFLRLFTTEKSRRLKGLKLASALEKSGERVFDCTCDVVQFKGDLYKLYKDNQFVGMRYKDMVTVNKGGLVGIGSGKRYEYNFIENAGYDERRKKKPIWSNTKDLPKYNGKQIYYNDWQKSLIGLASLVHEQIIGYEERMNPGITAHLSAGV